ncbi:antihemorrhagic factor cHLP-A-like [Vanacampus margaritifer]
MWSHLLLVLLCCALDLLGAPSVSPPRSPSTSTSTSTSSSPPSSSSSPPSSSSSPSPLLSDAPSTVTCDKAHVTTAARFGVRVIDEKRKHGFKFKLHEVQSSKYQQLSDGNCDIHVDVALVQTKCHFTNPKPEDQCDLFRQGERGTWATCAIKLSVRGKAATVTRYECITKPEPTNDELFWMRPDFPALLPLDDPTGLKAVDKAVLKFNKESKLQHYFALMEVAHVTIGSVPTRGTITWIMFALVETNCPREATHTFAPCTPLCLDRAQHLFCETFYFNFQDKVGELECELYLPKELSSLPDGDPEPDCGPLFHQSPEFYACKAQLSHPVPTVHNICPFPLKVVLRS